MKDHNTKFFHTVALMNRKNNQIHRIEVDGVYLTEVDLIKASMKQYFENNFHQTNLPHKELPYGVFKSFSSNIVAFLDQIPN